MALTLIKEDGSQVADANTYVTLAEAEAFFEAIADSTDWDGAADDAAKNAALVNAAFILERQYKWKGARVSPSSQAMQWPRWGVEEPDREVETDEIPEAIREAQCLLARELLGNSGAFEVSAGSGGLSALDLGQGALKVSYATGASEAASRADRTIVGVEIRALLEPYGVFQQGKGRVRVRRG